MKTEKHTPGPWKEATGHIYGTNGFWVCDPRCEIPTADNMAEMDANTQLIAAAPDLLAACKYVVDWHREHDSGEGELFGLDFVTTCIAAIAKAEGRE